MGVIRWPQTIAKRNRIKLDTGHRSCCLRRLAGKDAFYRQPIDLIGFIIITPAAGSVLVERDGERRVIEEGDAAMIPEGELKLTEIRAPGLSHTDVYYFFFNMRVLRDRLGPHAWLEQIAGGLIPWVTDIGLVTGGLTHALFVIRNSGMPFPGGFSKVLTVLINRLSAALCSVLAKSFFLPRLQLNLMMEQRVLGNSRHDNLAAEANLDRALRLYQGISAKVWLRKRRAQLARLWLAHSAAEPREIAKRLGADFEGHFAVGRNRPASATPWEELNLDARRSLSTPFWLCPRSPIVPDPARPFGSAHPEADFWNAVSTMGQVDNVIEFQFGSHSPAAALTREFGLAQAA